MTKLIAALLIAATVAHAQLAPPIVHKIESLTQQQQRLLDMRLQQGANVEYRVQISVDGRWLPLAGLTGEWQGKQFSVSQPTYVSASVATVTNVTPNYFRFALGPDQTGTALTNWLYTVIVKQGANQYPLGEGRLDIQASAWTGSPSVLKSIVNWATISGYTNTATHGPVRADGSTVSATTNADGSITLSATASAVTWTNVTDKPFTNLIDLTEETLTGVDFTRFATGTPLYVESDPVFTNWLASASFFTPTDLPTDYGTDWTTLTSSIAAKQDAGAYLVSGDNVSELTNDAGYAVSNTLGTAAFTAATNYPTLAGDNVFTGATNRFNYVGSTLNLVIGKIGSETAAFGYVRDNGDIDVVYGPRGIRDSNARILRFDTRLLEAAPSIWQSEGTATNGNEIVNYATMITNLAPYALTSSLGTMATESTTNYYTIADTDALLVSPLIVPAIATGATVDVSTLPRYYYSVTNAVQEWTISPALVNTGQFYVVNYDSTLSTITWPATNLPHLKWLNSEYPTTNGVGYVMFQSTPLTTNWLAIVVEDF
jgi:hypothetical protein